jgi:putative FmdB family regulatory protein
MPIYEYQCDTCDNTFEKLVFQGDEEGFDCPKCGGKKDKKTPERHQFHERLGSWGLCAECIIRLFLSDLVN